MLSLRLTSRPDLDGNHLRQIWSELSRKPYPEVSGKPVTIEGGFILLFTERNSTTQAVLSAPQSRPVSVPRFVELTSTLGGAARIQADVPAGEKKPDLASLNFEADLEGLSQLDSTLAEYFAFGFYTSGVLIEAETRNSCGCRSSTRLVVEDGLLKGSFKSDCLCELASQLANLVALTGVRCQD